MNYFNAVLADEEDLLRGGYELENAATDSVEKGEIWGFKVVLFCRLCHGKGFKVFQVKVLTPAVDDLIEFTGDIGNKGKENPSPKRSKQGRI